MKFKGNLLLIRQEEAVSQTKGGIWIPDQKKEPRNIGTVLAIGDKVNHKFLDKQIMFNLQSAQDFEFEETKGKLIFVTDVIAILN